MGYFLAIIMGMTLGLLGGGGSILTVPILVYALGMDAKLSIALSLAIVGLTGLVGIASHIKQKNIEIKLALLFTPIAMLGTSLGTYLSRLISAEVQLLIFATLMLSASYSMFKKKENSTKKSLQNKNFNWSLIPVALLMGIITGIVGVGGGFLIVPTLVLITQMDMKKAVGTSLFIISVNSLYGFMGYLQYFEIPWVFLAKFSAFSVLGIIIGSALSRHVSQKQLRKSFAIFLLLMGALIIYKNIYIFSRGIT